MGDLDTKIASHEEQIKNNTEDIKEIKSEMEKNRQHREDTAIKMNNFDRDIQDIKMKLDEHNNRFDKVDNRFDKVDNRFDEVINSINSLGEKLKKDTDEYFDKLKNKNKELNERIQKLENKDNDEKLKRYNGVIKFFSDGTKSLLAKVLFSVPFLYGLFKLIGDIISGLNK